MGSAMATRLIRAGFDVTVWNRTIADAARADVVITMLADDVALEKVVFDGPLIDRLPRGSVHVSMSTISVALAERLTTLHAEHNTIMISAPVFGRPEAAAAPVSPADAVRSPPAPDSPPRIR
jgi:3-hydroxyisobutyrate dehydrogenase-like beta-hydroxyacid dehydrogenase